jgi:hypothetical protein
MLTAQTIDAATLKIAWDPPSDGITAGYIVWVGTTPQSLTQTINVGATISYEINSLQDGVTYYVAIQSYSIYGDLSPVSAPVIGVARGGGSGGVPGNAPPYASFTSPVGGAVFIAPATIPLSVAASDLDGTVARVDFYVNGSPLGSITTAPYAGPWPGVGVGTYTLTAVVTDDRGASTTSAPVTIAVVPPGQTPVTPVTQTSAAFVRTDTATRGSWIGKQGFDGHAIPNDSLNIPDWAQLSVSGAAQYQWTASTTDVRALERANQAGRAASTLYNDAFEININLTDGQAHQLTLYSVDWDNNGRAQRIDIHDAVTGVLLDSQSMSNFGGGHHLTWTLRGNLRIRVTRTAGINAVVSALFFDAAVGVPPPPTTPPPATTTTMAASFVRTDLTTRGSWLGTYGLSGYGVAGDVVAFPAFAQVGLVGVSAWTWEWTTSDVRALQRASSASRVAATGYGSSFDIDVTLTDGRSHQLAFYMVDWENARRSQRFEVFDAASGTLLDSRTISDFSGGVYLVWNVSGHVIVRVTSTGGPNAVVSALFID